MLYDFIDIMKQKTLEELTYAIKCLDSCYPLAGYVKCGTTWAFVVLVMFFLICVLTANEAKS